MRVTLCVLRDHDTILAPRSVPPLSGTEMGLAAKLLIATQAIDPFRSFRDYAWPLTEFLR